MSSSAEPVTFKVPFDPGVTVGLLDDKYDINNNHSYIILPSIGSASSSMIPISGGGI